MAKNTILKQSDVEINSGHSAHPTSHFVSGTYGAAVYHPTLKDPIAKGGNWARGYAGVYNDNQAWGHYMIKKTFDNGLYHGPLQTNRNYSFRAWLRTENTNYAYHGGIGLCLKTKATEHQDSGVAYKQYPAGYMVWLRAANTDETTDLEPDSAHAHTTVNHHNYLIISTHDKADGDPITDPTNARDVICGGGDEPYNQYYNRDGKGYKDWTWHRIRADLIQGGGGGDTINVYTSSAGDVSPGNEVWELVGTKSIPSTMTNIYIDPTESDIRMGWAVYVYEKYHNKAYISNFEILVEDT